MTTPTPAWSPGAVRAHQDLLTRATHVQVHLESTVGEPVATTEGELSREDLDSIHSGDRFQ